MTNDDRIAELLVAWEEARQAGRRVSVSELCRDTPELLAEVERRIAALGAMELALDTQTDEITRLASSGSGSGSGWIGIPGYECLGVLGAGGMGVVFKARQLRLDRIVAIKLVRSPALTDSQLARVQSEAEAAARLNHPNIVGVHEIGEHGGSPFVVLEFVDGDDLTARIADATLRPKEAAGLMETVARAVHFAHEAGVIHRDLKPANVLLTRDGTPKIADFGLAKRLDEDSDLTRTGDVMGTPSYMAPEQARGEVDRIDRRTDVYALGATLYETLTGRPPFKGTTPLDTLRLVTTAEVLPPSRLHPGVPRDLETVCLKCLEKDPDQRYGSALELADDLQRFSDGEPVRARPVGRIASAWRWAKRHPARAGLMASAVVAVAALAAVGVGTRYQRRLELVNDELEDSLVREQKLTTQLKGALAGESQANETLNRVLYYRRVALALNLWRNNEVARARQVLEDLPRKYRHFEWHYVNRLCQGELRTFVGHDDEVNGIAFSPDGTRMASTSRDGTIRVWETATARQLLKLTTSRWGDTIHPRGVAFSPDGQRLAGSAGNFVHVWSAQSGRKLLTLKGHAGEIHSVAFSPKGAGIAAASKSTLSVWDAKTGRARFHRPARSANALSYRRCNLRFSPDENTIFVCSVIGRDRAEGDRVSVLEAATGREIREFLLAGPTRKRGRVLGTATDRKRRKSQQPATSSNGPVEFSQDGTRMATADIKSGTIRIYDVTSGREVLDLSGHPAGTYGICFSPDGKFLASGGKDRLIKIWGTRSGNLMTTLRGSPQWVENIVFSPDGTHVATGGFDAKVRLWKSDDDDGRRDVIVQPPFSSFSKQRFSTDGRSLFFTGRTVFVSVVNWNIERRRLTRRYSSFAKVRIHDFRRQSDGNFLVAVVTPTEIQIRDITNNHLIRVLEGEAKNFAWWLRFDPTGRLVAGAKKDNVIRVWDARTGKVIWRLKGHEKRVSGLAFGPDSRRLASSSEDGTLRIWSLKTGRVTHVLKGHAKPVTCVAFCPDGKRVASGSADRTARIWDVDSGREILKLTGHLSTIKCVGFSPDGKRLATGAYRTLKIWDAEAGVEAITLDQGSFHVEGVAFSPDGRLLVSSYGNGFSIWDARSGTW